MDYWLDVFTPQTWREFVASGATVTGFRSTREKYAKNVSQGDRLLCYLKGKLGWVGALESCGPMYVSDQPLWGSATFPVRLPVKPLITLPEEHSLSMIELEGQLSFYPKGIVPAQYSAYLQGSPRHLKYDDGEAIFRALKRHEDAWMTAAPEPAGPALPAGEADERGHTDAQLLLAKLGLEMGCSVWIPRGDRQRVSRAAGEQLKLLDQLPLLFGGRVQNIVENIDVIWLRGATVLAAFEVEHSTVIYSGLLRMSDLVASNPNIHIAIYIVAPEARRTRVEAELVRPTFNALMPPLHEICGVLTYERLHDHFDKFGPMIRHLRPESIKELAHFVEPA